MATTTGKNVRLYILEADEPRLEALCEKTGLTITDALTKIVTAGLRALEAEHYKVTLPLRFTVSEGESSRDYRLNDPKKVRGK